MPVRRGLRNCLCLHEVGNGVLLIHKTMIRRLGR
jgi:hypothetical protein